jgi:hypothetical protein
MATTNMLGDIVKQLESKDHKIRFVGEYRLIHQKAEALDIMIDNYYDNKLGFVPTTPIAVLEAQSNAMWAYLKILEYRADLELVDLPRS